MEKLLNRMTSYLCAEEREDTQEVICYGLEILVLKIIFWISAVIIGLLMGVLFENIVYMGLFTILRSYSGGYHAKSRVKCFVQSMLSIILSMCILKISDIYNVVNLGIAVFTIFSFVIIFILSPIDTQNKQLDYNEFVCFRIKVRIILFTEVILATITYLIGLTSISNSIMLAIITSGMLVTVGYIDKNKSQILK